MTTKAAGFLSLPAAVLLVASLASVPTRAEATGFPDVVERVEAGTVMIEAQGRDEVRFGTGFLLESPAVVITAFHVVEGAKRIRVAIPGSFLTSDALLVGGSQEWDVAVLKIPWPEEVVYPGLILSPDLEALPAGTDVAYTGYGYGSGPLFVKVLSTFRGIVSSHVPYGSGSLYHLSSFVSRGLSGSALYVPGSGEVVGVVTRHFGPPEAGMGYGGAVPSSELTRLVDRIFH